MSIKRKGTSRRKQILTEAAYYAAIYGHYDTSEAAQQTGQLTITVLDADSPGHPPLPPGGAHRVFVLVNQTTFVVTRYRRGLYQVEPADQSEPQRQERALRDAVLDLAVWQMSGEGSDHHSNHSREQVIKVLLAEGSEAEEGEDVDPLPHAVVRDERPDLSVTPAGVSLRVRRQWSVQIGSHACEVGLTGYRDDGCPELVVIDAQPEPPLTARLKCSR